MIRLCLFLLLCTLSSSTLLAQESLRPLVQNPYVERSTPPGVAFLQDSSFLPVYPLDTLSLPIIDDFSTDRFKPYSRDTAAPGVEDSVFYHLFDTQNEILRDTIGSWNMDTVGWMNDTSFTFHLDTNNGDTVVDSRTPLPSREILINDLLTPEHDTFRLTVWPALRVNDSIWTGNVDTNRIDPPHRIQDSIKVYYFPPDSNNIWTDRKVFLNNTLSDNPPTIGFASFDGLDEDGLPYNFNDPYAYGEADQLNSKPIDLSSTTPFDSVFLSFFYQRQGLGNESEPEDSLVLEFYSPGDSTWNQVWSKEGGSGTNPRQVLVPVLQPKYHHKGFRFRFKNFATFSGAFDHWHLDYVRIFADRNANDTVISDIAFTRLPSSFLETYSSVPWEHYQQDPGHVRDNYVSQHRNLDNAGRFVEFDTKGFFEGSLFWQHDQGVNAAVGANTGFTHNNLIGGSPSDLEFDPITTDTSAIFDLSLIQRTNPDTNARNDSISFRQRFENYYAYDDGTAEVAYGVSPSGANTPKIAVRYDPYVADTLIGAYIHFAPAFEDKTDESFFLTIWENDGGKPGNKLQQNISFSTPRYGEEKKHFALYLFDDPVSLDNANPYFIGIDQTTQERINIGLDRNTDNSQHLYYNGSGTWSNSSFEGSLMIRPIYLTDMDLLSQEEPNRIPELDASIYPNPSDGMVRIRTTTGEEELQVQVFEASGRHVHQKKLRNDGRLDLSDAAEGLYILRIRDLESGRAASRKLLIQR